MMKPIFIFLLFSFSFCLESFAQDEDEYYTPPSQRKDVKNSSYPNLNRKAVSLYASIEGGFKLNHASQTGTIENLVSFQNEVNFIWGVNVGYNFDNRWAIETGYLKNPAFFQQSLAVGGRGVPIVYKTGTYIHTIPLRVKYRVLTIDAITKSAFLYLGAGVLLAANANNKQISKKGYINTYTSQRKDSLILETFLSKKSVAVFEIQTELNGRVANGFYISLFGKMNFGANNIVNTDIAFYQNGNKIQSGTQYLKGISYNFGLSLRFDLARGYQYKSKVD